MQFPKKAPKKADISIDDYKAMLKCNPNMIPKKSMLQPKQSKTMRSVLPESALQKVANELIELKRWWFIRFENWFLYWMRQQEPKYQKHFFGQVAGKLPDNLIMVELGKGMFLGVKMELKTEDAKGKAVGKLHGKQKRYAEKEDWIICRNTNEIVAALEQIECVAEKIRKVI